MKLPSIFTKRVLINNDASSINLSPGKTFVNSDLQLAISCFGIYLRNRTLNLDDFESIKNGCVALNIGAPGLPNVEKILYLGDAVLYQLPNYGVVEIRATDVGNPCNLLISKISPRSGFAATHLAESDNVNFSEDESSKIESGFSAVIDQVSGRSDVTTEQLAFLESKLTEIANASKRLGRKDWIMFTLGSLTNVLTSAAFSPEAAKAIFIALNNNLSWVFQNALRLAIS